MIQLILQLQHLHQVFGQAVFDLNTVQAVHPTVEVSSPKDYLMILDHGRGVKVVKADPFPDLLLVLVPALKFNDTSGQVGVDEAGGHVVKVPSQTWVKYFLKELIIITITFTPNVIKLYVQLLLYFLFNYQLLFKSNSITFQLLFNYFTKSLHHKYKSETS